MIFRILNLHKLFGLCLLLGLASSLSLAQSTTITGRVRSDGGSVPPQPKVMLLDQHDAAVVRGPVMVDDATGKFEIKNVQEGKYVVVGCAGTTYNPSQLEIEVKEGRARPADLILNFATRHADLAGKSEPGKVSVSALAYGCEVASTPADERGRFKFERLPVPPKAYTLSVQRNGKPVESNPIQVTAGRSVEVSLAFKSDKGFDLGLVAKLELAGCDRTKHEQTDLSGTYEGRVNYPDAGLMGYSTLTVTGNYFTLTAGSTAQSGRITAVTTCGYTGVTMMFGDLTPPPPGPNPPASLAAVSLKANVSGDRVALTSVRNEKRYFEFGLVGSARVPRKARAARKHRE